MSTGTGIDDDLLTRASSLASENGAETGTVDENKETNENSRDARNNKSCYRERR